MFLAKDWLDCCRSALVGRERGPSYALVANKIDLEHLRVIKSDRHHKFAQENGLLTYAVSAKTGEGVSLCMQKIAADLLGTFGALSVERARQGCIRNLMCWRVQGSGCRSRSRSSSRRW